MRYIKKFEAKKNSKPQIDNEESYNLFESQLYGIFGRTTGFKNQSVLDDIISMLVDLEDLDYDCRIWINNQSKVRDTVRIIRIEINYDEDNLEIGHTKYDRQDLDDFLNRLKSYLTDIGRLRITFESDEFMELNISIFK
jgi:hypothetical protein